MKKISLLLFIILLTSLICFFIGYKYKESQIQDNIANLQVIIEKLKEENQSLQNQTKNSNHNYEEQNTTKTKDDEFKHSIDIEEEKCLAETHVYNYPSCSQKAEKAWNKEIQKNLALLKDIMNKEDFEYISEMNSQWEKSVHSEIEIINRFISSKDGVIYQTEGSNNISILKKQYALLLESVYFHYKEEKEGIF